eukprot:1144603-Pelagomonas_calceolata.AAC.2
MCQHGCSSPIGLQFGQYVRQFQHWNRSKHEVVEQLGQGLALGEGAEGACWPGKILEEKRIPMAEETEVETGHRQ